MSIKNISPAMLEKIERDYDFNLNLLFTTDDEHNTPVMDAKNAIFTNPCE